MKQRYVIASLLSPVLFSSLAHSSEQNVWYFINASDPFSQGFVRVENLSATANNITVTGVNESGDRTESVTLNVPARQTVTLNSDDIEFSNTAKGLSSGIGSGAGAGSWRLVFDSNRSFRVNAYERTTAGNVVGLNDVVINKGRSYNLPIFNPASNTNQRSVLRIYNLNRTQATVSITGQDDKNQINKTVRLKVPANQTVELTSQELESGAKDGLSSGLGDGGGKWSLSVTSTNNIRLVNLLKDPNGHVSNLSSLAETADEQTVWYFANASDDFRQGFIRVANQERSAINISVQGVNEAGERTAAVTLNVPANQTVTLNSDDIEFGNAAKGLSTGIGSGAGTGTWRLELHSDKAYSVNSYERTTDGEVFSLNQVVSRNDDGAFDIPMFNPGSNPNQQSVLRVYNLSDQAATISITGKDDKNSINKTVTLSVAGNQTVDLTAQELENGSKSGLSGGLGDGGGKWSLSVTSDSDIRLMNLMKDPYGHVSNLSATTQPSAEFKIYSESFADGGKISSTYACSDYGSEESPELHWQNIPVLTEKLAVVVDDETSPCGKGSNACTHWDVANISPGRLGLEQNIKVSAISASEKSGGYFGMCPPSGTHIYNFAVYALGNGVPEISSSDLGQYGLNRSQFETKYGKYILDKAMMTGKYTR